MLSQHIYLDISYLKHSGSIRAYTLLIICPRSIVLILNFEIFLLTELSDFPPFPFLP